MAQATMQENHGWTGPVSGVPDLGAVVVHVTLIARDGQRWGSVFFKSLEVVVGRFHSYFSRAVICHRRLAWAEFDVPAKNPGPASKLDRADTARKELRRAKKAALPRGDRPCRLSLPT